jgi:hypothetical protein
MGIKHTLDKALDFSIVLGYSAFAFAIMPALVVSAWIFDRDVSSADLNETD